MISVLVYEWRRLWSLRATWIMSGLYLVFVGLLGGLTIFLDKLGPAQSWKGLYSASSNLLCFVILSVVAAQSFGHEYRYGTIRLTLSEFPRRERVLFAKVDILGVYYLIMMTLGWSVLGLIGAVAPAGRLSADAVGYSLGGDGAIPEMWKVLAFGWGYLLLSFSITLITRNLALGIVMPLLLATLFEGIVQIIATLTKGKFDWLAHIMPMSNGQDWLTDAHKFAHPGLVFWAWVVGLLLAATIRFARSDA